MGVRINELAAAAGRALGGGDAPAPETKPGEEANATASLFPSGTGALYKLADGKKTALEQDEPVRLINVSLSSVTMRTVNEAIKNPKGFEEKTVEVLPFGYIVLPHLHARRVLETQEKPGGDPKMVVAPLDGDCGGAMNFTGYGKRFRTCPFAECKTCGPLPARISWSVFQVQHRISMLGTEPAIRRVIETIDQRNAVVMWGLEIITQRTRAKQERLGLVGQVNPLSVTF